MEHVIKKHPMKTSVPKSINIFATLLIVLVSQTKIANAEIKILHFDEPFRISRHAVVSNEVIFDRFNERCFAATGEKVKFNTEKGTQNILLNNMHFRILDLSQLRCEDWKNEWELGTIALGSGGNEWAIIINESYIVRVRGSTVNIAKETNKSISITVVTHPTYCANVDQLICEKKFSLEYSK